METCKSKESQVVSNRRRQYFAAFAATMSAFSLGTVLGYTSPALPNLEDDIANNNTNIIISNESEKGLVASIVSVGALIVCPLSGYLLESVGRKGTIKYMLPPYLGGWLLIAFAQNLSMLLAGRFITGLCSGAFTMAVPVYIAEISDDEIRGLLGSSTQFMVTSGILFVYVVGAFANWNILALICGGIAVVSFVFILLIPESPDYLLNQNETKKAKKSHVYFKGENDASLRQFDQMEQRTEALKTKIVSKKPLLTQLKCFLMDPAIWKPTALCVGLMFFQQLSGINIVVFYTVEIFRDAGLSQTHFYENLSAIAIGVVQMLAMIPSSLLVDRVGRKILLSLSGGTMTLTLVAIGIFFHIKEEDSTYAIEYLYWLPLTGLILFKIAYSIGYGPIPMMMTGELVPADAKGFVSGISIGTNWFLVFAMTQWFGVLKNAIGVPWCYFSFAVISAIGVLFIMFLVPETKQKSLDEIQLMFVGKGKKTRQNVNCEITTIV